MKKLLYILTPLLLIALVYFFWSKNDRVIDTENIFPRYVIGNVEEFGNKNGKGNIIALSPYLHTTDFSSQSAFFNMMHYYFSFAKRKKLLNDSTIIVLPEYIGSWLVTVNEKRSMYADTSLEEGMQTVIVSNLFKFGTSYLISKSEDKKTEAVFKMKADKMLEIYQTTFSKLAKEFHVIIVAGSVVLPDPSVKDGKIEINKSGKLYNISAVFDVSGKVIAPLTKKIYPIEEEKTFTCCADKNTGIPVYKTPAGNLAVLICADAWYPQNYNSLKNKNINILAVPSFVSGNDSWIKRWKGYNGAVMPTDIDKTDIGKITEYEAWKKYSMLGRIQEAGIKTGVNVFLRGELWNLGTDGHTLIWCNNKVQEPAAPNDKTGSLINVWL
ncbi:MAG: nitrilase-related carbon-nitrogen hydrolase [Chitinophagales bacterium]